LVPADDLSKVVGNIGDIIKDKVVFAKIFNDVYLKILI